MTEERSKTRILLIEDNAADVELLRRAVRGAQMDCEWIVLDDGAEAVSFVLGMQKEAGLDLAVLDLNLPKVGGIEVLAAMRASSRFDAVPVAVVTSSRSAKERAEVEHYGVGRYIQKSPDLDEFMRIGWMLKELLAEQGHSA